MKGYCGLFLVSAAFLLIFPLAILPSYAGVTDPDISGGAESTVSEAPADDPAPSSETAESDPPAPAFDPEKPGDSLTSGDGWAGTADPDGGNTFRVRTGGTVLEMTDREFLFRNLAYEMPAAYHPEALKAQTVAAYTYYGRQRQLKRKAGQAYDFNAPGSQFPSAVTNEALQSRWGSHYDEYVAKLRAAVDAVYGKSVTYGGALIDACYFAVSNGKTEDAAVVWNHKVAYLVSVDSHWDTAYSKYETAVTVTPDQLKAALTAKDGTLSFGKDPARWIGKPTLSDAGTVVSLPVGSGSLTGAAVRAALGLRSASFSVAYRDGAFHFTVRGHGHGVGMSQVGANGMAKEGADWQAILLHYYPGTAISG